MFPEGEDRSYFLFIKHLGSWADLSQDAIDLDHDLSLAIEVLRTYDAKCSVSGDAVQASGDMISRRQFEEFVLPYQRWVIQRIKAKGAETLVHICGDVTDRLDLIPATGAGILSVDYKVDLARAAEVLAGKMAFAGNMNPVGVMQALEPEGVAWACRACIEQAGAASSHILMPGCDIPPGVPLENIRAMVDTAWGRT